MDPHLVHQCVHYHGPQLVDILVAEQPEVPLPHFLSLGHGLNKEEPRDEEFTEKLNCFIAQKADLLFVKQELDALASQTSTDDKVFSVMAPLESYMEISPSLRRDHFFKSVGVGDIVVGVVTAIQESGLTVTLLCMDEGKVRDLNQLKITTFCPLREIPKYYAHESPLDAFAIKDKVRGIVLSVNEEMEKMVISLQSRSLPPDKAHVKMGLISDEDLPLHYRELERMCNQTYLSDLRRTPGFSNPSSEGYLCSILGLAEDVPPSLMRGLYKVEYPKEEYAENLRKSQSSQWALRSVAEGIKLFKQSKHAEAMQHFNKALEIDADNVEALVARGAVYANSESYSRAIEDFKAALSHDPRHVNAQKYLCETLLAQAHSLQESGKPEAAFDYCERALNLKPDLPAGLKLAASIQEDIRGQQEGGRRSHEEESDDGVQIIEREERYSPSLDKTTETLRKLIQEEEQSKKKRKRKSRSPESVQKRTRAASSSVSQRRRHSSSSSSSSDSSSSSSSKGTPSSSCQDVIALYRSEDLSPGSQQYLSSKGRNRQASQGESVRKHEKRVSSDDSVYVVEEKRGSRESDYRSRGSGRLPDLSRRPLSTKEKPVSPARSRSSVEIIDDKNAQSSKRKKSGISSPIDRNISPHTQRNTGVPGKKPRFSAEYAEGDTKRENYNVVDLTRDTGYEHHSRKGYSRDHKKYSPNVPEQKRYSQANVGTYKHEMKYSSKHVKHTRHSNVYEPEDSCVSEEEHAKPFKNKNEVKDDTRKGRRSQADKVRLKEERKQYDSGRSRTKSKNSDGDSRSRTKSKESNEGSFPCHQKQDKDHEDTVVRYPQSTLDGDTPRRRESSNKSTDIKLTRPKLKSSRGPEQKMNDEKEKINIDEVIHVSEKDWKSYHGKGRPYIQKELIQDDRRTERNSRHLTSPTVREQISKGSREEKSSSGQEPKTVLNRKHVATDDKKKKGKSEERKQKEEEDAEGESTPKESLADMENFLATLKSKKKELMQQDSQSKPKTSYKRW